MYPIVVMLQNYTSTCAGHITRDAREFKLLETIDNVQAAINLYSTNTEIKQENVSRTRLDNNIQRTALALYRKLRLVPILTKNHHRN